MNAPVAILIVYDSLTGNTERMAQAVAEGARQAGSVAVAVKRAEATTNEDLLAADGIIVGSPAYYGLMTAKVKHLLDASVTIHGRLEGKAGAAFCSAGSTATGAETTLLSILQALLVHGMVVQGRSGEKHYGAACVGAPDAVALGHCRELGARTARLAARLAGAEPVRSTGGS